MYLTFIWQRLNDLLFFLMIRRPPRSTLFPTRRSSDLGDTEERRLVRSRFRSRCGQAREEDPRLDRKRSEEHTSELQSLTNLVCRLLLEKKNINFQIEYPDITQSTTRLPMTT